MMRGLAAAFELSLLAMAASTSPAAAKLERTKVRTLRIESANQLSWVAWVSISIISCDLGELDEAVSLDSLDSIRVASKNDDSNNDNSGSGGVPVLELVSGRRELFVDELHVATRRGIVTEFHRAQKKGAVIRSYGDGNMTGAVQTRSMPQWNPRKQLFELPVLGGDSASDLHNFDGQSHAQWFESKEGLQWWLLAISGEVIK